MPIDESNRTGPEILRQHPVSAFFMLAFLISWGGILVITLPTGIPGSGEALDRLYGLVFVPMLAGPFLSAIVISACLGGWAGLVKLLQRVSVWRAKPFEYAAAFLVIPACSLAVLLPLSVVSPAFTPGFLSPQSGFAMIALALGGGFVVGLIEETGWTGFATPRLLNFYSLLVAAISLGVIHGFWHLLVTVWASGAEYELVFVPFFLTLWVLALVALRILIVWVFARTESTLLAAITHASHSGWLFVVWPPATTPVQDVIWTAAFGLLGLAAALSITILAPPDDLKTSGKL